jgi:TetR/AcrR family transcriptional regulator, fatty acid biosynthesis regulator
MPSRTASPPAAKPAKKSVAKPRTQAHKKPSTKTSTKPSKKAIAVVNASAAPRRRQRLAPEERAGQILDFAARLILEEGFTEVSMERLGREAGISKALIYNYFPNRNDLLRALLEREVGLLRGRQVAEVRAAGSFKDLVHRTTRIYVEHVNERGALLQRLWAESAVSRTVAEVDLQQRFEAMQYFARRVTKEYGIPHDVALSAVDMQMAMTEAAAQHLANSHNDVDFATDICVTLLLGGLDALAGTHGRGVVKKPVARRTAAAPKKPALKSSRS